MKIECTSKCTGLKREYCSIGVNDLGYYECAECGSEFSKIGIFKNLQKRHGMNWELGWEDLKVLKREVVRMRKKLMRMGFILAETVYLNMDLNPYEHSECLEKEKQKSNPDPSKPSCVLIPKLPHHLK